MRIVALSMIVLAGVLPVGGGAGDLPASDTNNLPAALPESVLTPTQRAQGHFDLGVRFMQEKKYTGAIEAFQKAVELKPDFSEAHNNWGICLVQLGKQIDATQSLEKYEQAVEQFSKAAALKPNERITYMLWSEALLLIGDLPVSGGVRLACYQGAVEKCRKVVELAPKDWEAYNKWAVILSTKLSDFAQTEATALKLYREAAGLFAKAVQRARFSGDLGPIYANWGSALVRAARVATDSSEKRELLADAIDKFERSARAVPNAAKTYTMWGTALVERGKLTHMRSDYRDGIDRFNIGTSLDPQDVAALYNLACAYALVDNSTMAVQTLKKCFEQDITKTYYAAAPEEPNLAGIRSDREFQELFNTAGTRQLPSDNPRLGDSPR